MIKEFTPNLFRCKDHVGNIKYIQKTLNNFTAINK